jgi:gliding motility-associated-like protein
VVVTDANNCSSTQIFNITSPPAITAQATSQNVNCFGGNNGSAAVTASGGTTPYSYSWNSVPPQTTANATGLPAGSYTVTITDANNCTQTATVSITQPTQISTVVNTTNFTCNSSPGSATVAAGGGTPGYTYSWSTTPPQTSPVATGLTPGTYTVTVTDANNCTVTATGIVGQNPLADTLAIIGFFCPGDSAATLYAPQGFSNYQWYENGNSITGATTDSLLITNTTSFNQYTVTWMYNGCVRNTTVKVITEPPPAFIPDSTANVFSPNGDGRNDFFFPYKTSSPTQQQIDYYTQEFNIKVYTRWGNLVFESSDYGTQWDGRYNGKEADAGVYYWIATFKPRCPLSEEPVIQKGFVHLLR